MMAELMMGFMLLLIVLTGAEYLVHVIARWNHDCSKCCVVEENVDE